MFLAKHKAFEETFGEGDILLNVVKIIF